IPVDVVVSSLEDERGLRAAMVGVKTVYHLAGGEWRGAYANLFEIDIRGTQSVVQAASAAEVNRIYYVSHLGADRGSAYPVFKAKAIAEEYIRRGGIDYTILRTAVVFGQNDGFTNGLAKLMHLLPYFFLVPGDGDVLIQPLWVEDLATCLVWSLEDGQTRNQTYEVGGPEYLPFNHVAQLIMDTIGLRRNLVPVRPPYLRGLTVFLEDLLPAIPVSAYWLDYLATDRTCALDTIPRFFNLMPARISHKLDYLHGVNWQKAVWGSVFRRRLV
ncbi:MAG: NAD(P)H-binding protein, partial [Anaerolineales bacterium]|nr:NAD(P)H-binding protein [Anaerolineales bacterium]